MDDDSVADQVIAIGPDDATGQQMEIIGLTQSPLNTLLGALKTTTFDKKFILILD
jgi:hypothetical protein